MARASAGRTPLLHLLQRAQDVRGQARERAAKGTHLPPGFSRVDAQLARRVVGLEFARDCIRLVRCSDSPTPPMGKKKLMSVAIFLSWSQRERRIPSYPCTSFFLYLEYPLYVSGSQWVSPRKY